MFRAVAQVYKMEVMLMIDGASASVGGGASADSGSGSCD